MISNRSIASQFALVLALLALLTCGLSMLWLQHERRGAEAWVRHTETVEDALAQTRIAGLRAEMWRLHFLIGGDVAQIDRYRAERLRWQQGIAQVATLTGDNPVQQRRIAHVRRVLGRHFADGERAIEIARRGDHHGAEAIALNPSSGPRLREITTLLDQVRAAEVVLATSRMQRAQRIEGVAETAMVVSILLILLLAGLVWRERVMRMRELRGANALLRDDIERREAAEAQLAVLADNATDVVIRHALDGHILYASPSTREMFNVPPDAIVGKPLLAGVHPEDKPAVEAVRDQLAKGSADRIKIAYRAMSGRHAGEWIWVEAMTRLVRDAEGAPHEIIASLRDITQRKTIEAELTAARERAEAAAAAKASFLAHMSHEIRTPMNGVIGFTELLSRSELSADQRRQVELIADSGRAMMRLLNDILDHAKIEAGHMAVAREPFDLAHALRGCVRLIAPVAEQKGLVFELELADDLPARTCGDALRLRQIVLNLLGNAVKFTEHGRVTLRAARCKDAPDQLCLTVEDTGVGIAPERQQAIFEQFVQADVGTAARYGGTGLGLTISARLAQLMGGALSVTSQLGKGTAFRLLLPLHQACDEAAGTAPEAAPVATAPLPGRNVLVAEDHDVNQMLITDMLRSLGARVTIAENGEVAERLVSEAIAAGTPFDIVLMDVQMPVTGGLEATRRLRAGGMDAARLPIVALTANAYADDIAACREAGMQDHVAKPVKLDDLATKLARWALQGVSEPAKPVPRAPVAERYRMRKAEALAALDEMVRRGAFTDVELEAAADALHKLAGTAALFGEAALGDRARELEDGIAGWPEDGRAQRIRDAVAAIRAAA